ncbi:MAG: hypothetical protein GXY13_12800 [Acidimicrobiales bacterium]|nr:hypothetical protein [Acidimicrobiales bacterium]
MPRPTLRRPLVVRTLAVACLAIVLSACQNTWGIRESYRNYIAGPIAHGEIIASNGAGHPDGGSGPGKGAFTWGLDSSSFNAANNSGWVKLKGTVVVRGHRNASGVWVLESSFTNPLLLFNGTVGYLYVDLQFRPFEGTNPNPVPPIQTANAAPFAVVDLSGVSWAPDSNGKRTIKNAPMVGIDSTMELIGWDAFYGLPVTLDPLTVTF